MASFQEVELLTPNGKTDKVLQIKTGNESDAYRLPDLVHEVGSYTFVIWLKSDKACTVNFSILGNTYQANVTTEWTKHVQKVKIENLTNKNIDIAPSQNTTTYYYEAFLAKGEIDTSWIPAPEDADANFSRVYSEIKQTAEGIEQNVVSNVDKKISSINLTIEGITQRVSDAEQGVSEVRQKAGIIESSVSSLEGDVSKIKQQSDQVVIQVGNSIKSTVEEFYQSDSPTTLRGGYWSESQPTWTEGKYLWRRTKVTKGNDKISYTPSENGVCITGNTGSGQGVSDITKEYYSSTSKTEAIGGYWSENMPQLEKGRYLWTRFKITYENPVSIEYTTPICDTSWEEIESVKASIEIQKNRIDSTVEEVNKNKNEISNIHSKIEQTANEISLNVSDVDRKYQNSIDGINRELYELAQKAGLNVTKDQVEIFVRNEISKGTDKVTTNTGFTFNDNGLTVSKSNSEISTKITENGMKVLQNNTTVLEANNVGVNAKNLHATTYLIVGANSRFEDYGNNRTGCFWIGGV